MIKRILTLKDIGRFESLKSEHGNEGEFAKVNVVYAPNACGKTTLCDVFRSLDTRNPAYVIGRKRIGESTVPSIDLLSDSNTHWKFCNGQWMSSQDFPRVFVYDQRFVNDNVFVGGQIGIEQKRNVYNLALGQKAIELNRKVQEAGEKLARASDSVSQCESELLTQIPPGHRIETFRNLEKIVDVDVKIAELQERIAVDENKKAKASQIREHRFLQPITIPVVSKCDLEDVLTTTLDDASLTADSKIKAHFAECANTDQIPLEWIKRGYEIQREDMCPYCGQNMSHLELFSAYRAFFSGVLKQQEERRNEVKGRFHAALGLQIQNETIGWIGQNLADLDWWRDACGLLLNLPLLDVDYVKDVYSRTLCASMSAFERKQNNLTETIFLQEEEVAVFEALKALIPMLRSYNEAVEKANEKIRGFQESIEVIDIDESIRRLADLKDKKMRHEKNVVDAYRKYDEALELKKSAQAEKTRANEELKQESKSVFDRFGSKLNEFLSAFGVNFSIESGGVNLRGGAATGQLAIRIDANGSSAQIDSSSNAAGDPARMSLSNTLSAGDCSALGLAFFLARLDTDVNLVSSIVVIDDPYHDQDRSRQSQTIALLKRESNKCSQFFLLSHNLEFAQMFMANKGISRDEIRAFEIPQLGSSIALKHGDLPQLPSKAYETDYAELSDFATNSERYRDRLKEVVSRIRPLLETYFRYKYPLVWNDQDWLGDMIGKIRTSNTNDIVYPCNCLVQELDEINTYTKRFHHRVSGVTADVPDPIELGVYVNRTLKIIHHA